MIWVYTAQLPSGPITGTIKAKKKSEATDIVKELYRDATDIELNLPGDNNES